VFDTIVR